MILAGDIGGTKTQLALYDSGDSPRRPRREQRFPSHDYASLQALAMQFLKDSGGPRVTRAVFGIAGVVSNDHCETTNLPWHVDGPELSRALAGARVTLTNDLAATAIGLELLDRSELDVLQDGVPGRGACAVLAAGTGLGMVAAVRDGAKLVVAPSEGGHADYAPRNALEDELAAWLRARHGRASVEHVLSGRGIADLYRFCAATGRGAEPAGFSARFDASGDPAALVTESALDGSCERAQLALHLFIDAYGAEAGNLALRSLPTEGLYIGGGIAPRIRPAFHDGRFLAAFRDKPPMTDFLKRVPVAVILDPQAPLWGAARLALESNGGSR